MSLSKFVAGIVILSGASALQVDSEQATLPTGYTANVYHNRFSRNISVGGKKDTGHNFYGGCDLEPSKGYEYYWATTTNARVKNSNKYMRGKVTYTCNEAALKDASTTAVQVTTAFTCKLEAYATRFVYHEETGGSLTGDTTPGLSLYTYHPAGFATDTNLTVDCGIPKTSAGNGSTNPAGVELERIINEHTNLATDKLRRIFIAQEVAIDADTNPIPGQQTSFENASAIIRSRSTYAAAANEKAMACCKFRPLNKRSYKRLRDKVKVVRDKLCANAAHCVSSPAAVAISAITVTETEKGWGMSAPSVRYVYGLDGTTHRNFGIGQYIPGGSDSTKTGTSTGQEKVYANTTGTDVKYTSVKVTDSRIYLEWPDSTSSPTKYESFEFEPESGSCTYSTTLIASPHTVTSAALTGCHFRSAQKTS